MALLGLLLLATLAPAIARTMTALGDGSAPWRVVCVAAADGRSGVADPAGMQLGDSMDSCPFCLLRADLAPPPPGGLSAALPLVAGLAVPVLFLQSPRPLFAWHVAQPRGPPGAA